MVTREKATRFEDIAIDGSGVNVRGNVELDEKGDLVAANFPVFALSDGDKTSVRAERGSDGVMRVSMRGDVYDGRNFVKDFFGGEPGDKPKSDPIDLDFDMRLGVIAGHNGEALRGGGNADGAPQRSDSDLRAQFKDRTERHADRRDAGLAAAPERAAFRNARCRRADALHRYLSAHPWRPDVGRDGRADA